jgi:hypothetical protein
MGLVSSPEIWRSIPRICESDRVGFCVDEGVAEDSWVLTPVEVEDAGAAELAG